jgi:hypothetical protein
MGFDMTDFERRVLDKIEAQHLKPTPAYVFLAKRSVFWLLAGVSILFGAISFAMLLFMISDYFSTGWRVLDNIHFNEFLFVIPVVWLLAMGLFATSAAYGLRHTRRGHRFTPSSIAALVLAAGIVLGGGFHMADAGRAVHNVLAAHFPAYRNFTYVPFVEWSKPDAGFLGGTVMKVEGNTIQLLDFKDKTWTIDMSGAKLKLDDTMAAEGDIAIEGTRTGDATFHAQIISEFD